MRVQRPYSEMHLATNSMVQTGGAVDPGSGNIRQIRAIVMSLYNYKIEASCNSGAIGPFHPIAIRQLGCSNSAYVC